MELKQYQQEVLNDLAAYMEQLKADNDLRIAYSNYWLKKGIDISSIRQDKYIHPYDNSIQGVPRVMFKVPTAGGKTFIASNALKVIFDHLPTEQPKVVAWFVPSDAILKQTYQNLSNPGHPYRQRINSHFNNRVVVVDKETALSGVGIQPSQIQEQLTIFVLSVQSFIPAKNKKGDLTNEGLRSLRENSSLTEYEKLVNSDNNVEKADNTSLIQAIACLNPVVIVDESHNFKSEMRIDALTQINPSFILDLTATPREKSNVISFVDAMKLKQANMVKLPVVLYNRDKKEDVLIDAIQLRKKLEKRAKDQQAKGGRYIRPIVLLQAQPKSDKDNETFEKVKHDLIDAGIKESWIKIKTSGNDELKGIDLMSDTCEVRFIITVNALKEGWDCPFAYVLASLANKTSAIDVEQILGRVLRLPYTTKHADEFLNLSYVFTSSNDFRATVESVIKELNNAGFSSKDYRLANPTETEEKPEKKKEEPNLFSQSEEDTKPADTGNTTTGQTQENEADAEDENSFDVETVKKATEQKDEEPQSSEESGDNQGDNQDSDDHENDSVLKEAHDANKQYENDTKGSEEGDNNIPSDLKDKVNQYSIKEDFKAIADETTLPIFVKKINTGTIFSNEGELTKLTKCMLTEGFVLEKADKNINFTRTEQEAVRIDLEKRSEGEYVPKQYKMSDAQLHSVRELFVGYNVESKRRQLTGRIAKRLHFDEINEPHISNYIRDVLKDKSDEELTDLFDRDLQTGLAFKTKIDGLVAEYQHAQFKKLIDKGMIKMDRAYKFPTEITVNNPVMGLPKGLYTEEGEINNFEYQVISAVANCDNVLFWHRNPERGLGFCINGFINHYPDFIIRTHKGKTILLETKGDDRDNTDSRKKLELGTYWANKAGDNYRYFMVFDKTKLDGAHTKEEFLDILKDL